MAVLKQYVCDRCGNKESTEETEGWPEGWARLDIDVVDERRNFDICRDCNLQINKVLTKELVHVGYAKDSGSGTRYRSKSLGRPEAPCYDIFAFGRDLK